MNTYDGPGEGWRVLGDDERMPDGVEFVTTGTSGGFNGEQSWQKTVWIPQEPVPPLPTEPYTVIRVTWKDSDNVGCVYMLHPTGKWGPYELDYVRLNITGFEVLAEPRKVDLEWAHAETRRYEEIRRETAKAVLDRMRPDWRLYQSDIDFARKFGVTE